MNQRTESTPEGNTALSETLKSAIRDYESAASAVRETRKIRATLQSQLNDLHNRQTQRVAPDLQAQLIENGGKFTEDSEQTLFTSFMIDRKVKAATGALAETEERLLREMMVREKKANHYITAYLREVDPYIQAETDQLLDEIRTVFSKRIGRVLGLQQACKYGLTTGQESGDIPEDMTLKNRVMSEIANVFRENWTEYAVSCADSRYIGVLPDEVIRAVSVIPTPAQLKKAEYDENYRASLLSRL